MWQLFFFLFLDFQVLVHSLPFNNSSSPSPAKLCSPEQRFALIHFKNSLSIYSFGQKMNSWKENGDCCSWDGVTCDTFTGHVIGLDLSSSGISGIIDDNSTLFLLHHLQRLNLAFNYFYLGNISGKFGQFKELTHLNLSSLSFRGLVPTELSHLSNLVSLDLSSAPFRLKLSQDSFDKIAHNLKKLRYLHLDGVDMSSVAAASLVNLSSSLISLSLTSTYLQGKLPTDIFRLPFLQRISLSGNHLLTGNLPKSNWSGPLRFLDLSYISSFSSELPDTIGNLKYLNVLDLAYSNFRGSIPTSLGNLTEIICLDLTYNKFTGGIPSSISNLLEITSLNLRDNKFSGPFPDVFGNLSKLTHLSLSNNTFNGRIPPSAFNLTQIPLLDFSMNNFEGQIPSQVSSVSSLTELDLSYNLLSGEIPFWLFSLRSLESLSLNNNKFIGPIQDILFLNFNLTKFDLSSNNLKGPLKLDMLAKLKNLETIDLSHNNLLSITPNSNTNFTLPKLREFRFSFCNLNEFPKSLRNAENLKILDLSNNNISGKISLWEFGMWPVLNHLNLSQNFLTSFEQIPSEIQLKVLDLHSNLLQGPLLDLPTDIVFFSASNNKLTGEIPSSFCSLTSIEYLILSNNSLSGTIPHCLGGFSLQIKFLDLRMNNFHGTIPQTLARSSIRYLNLNGNRLVGQLPPSFVNCSVLEVLDVGNNKINDTFPLWLASLRTLQVLILRANRFHGAIGNPNTRDPFAKLRILDLSHNQFDSLLPTRYFANFKSMMHGPYKNDRATYMRGTQNSHPHDKRMAMACLIASGDETISGRDCPDVTKKGKPKIRPVVVIGVPYYSMVLTMKGSNMKVERILTSLTAIDFSNNLFEGEIPRVLGNLISLKMLNFSQNKLHGEMPSSLANLTELESLDLSSNKLIGEIPIQLTNLTFLAVLNLSYNQLRGRIPQGNQFGTFQNDYFIGNLGLCGSPLLQECGNKKAQEPFGPTMFLEEDDSLSWFDWRATMMGYACGLVIGFSLGYIVFVTRKPQWFVRMVERQLQTKMRRLGRRC